MPRCDSDDGVGDAEGLGDGDVWLAAFRCCVEGAGDGLGEGDTLALGAGDGLAADEGGFSRDGVGAGQILTKE